MDVDEWVDGGVHDTAALTPDCSERQYVGERVGVVPDGPEFFYVTYKGGDLCPSIGVYLELLDTGSNVGHVLCIVEN